MTDLTFAKEDQNGKFMIRATMSQKAMSDVQSYALKQNVATLHNRINELGVAEPVIAQQGADRIVVQLPGVQDTAKAKDILGRTATLVVRLVVKARLSVIEVVTGQDDLTFNQNVAAFTVFKALGTERNRALRKLGQRLGTVINHTHFKRCGTT